jgi:hypothetical protein
MQSRLEWFKADLDINKVVVDGDLVVEAEPATDA